MNFDSIDPYFFSRWKRLTDKGYTFEGYTCVQSIPVACLCLNSDSSQLTRSQSDKIETCKPPDVKFL